MSRSTNRLFVIANNHVVRVTAGIAVAMWTLGRITGNSPVRIFGFVSELNGRNEHSCAIETTNSIDGHLIPRIPNL